MTHFPGLFSSDTELDQPEFYYCTIQDLRDAGVPPIPVEGFEPGTFGDLRLQDEIIVVSEIFNELTGQFFQPWPKQELVDGTGGQSIHTHTIDKIIKVNSVFFKTHPEILSSISHPLFVRKERFISRVDINHNHLGISLIDKVQILEHFGHKFIFKEGHNNWVIDGVFGDIKVLPVIEKRLDASIAFGDVTISVDSVEGLRRGDSIVVGNQHFIINSTDSDLLVIGIDPSLVDIELESPSQEVIKHGRVHRDIKDAAIRLILDRIIGPQSYQNSDGSIKSGNDFICDNLFSEKTDNYTYILGKKTRKDDMNDSLDKGGSGNKMVDSVLRRHLPPPYAGYV